MLATATIRRSMAMPSDRVAHHLDNWERWMQSATLPGKIPKCASGGLRGYTGYDGDLTAAYEEMDRFAGAAVQAVIDGMPSRLRIAVYVEHHIMHAVFRLRDHGNAYPEACSVLAAELPKRSLS